MKFDKIKGGATNGEIYKGIRGIAPNVNVKVSIDQYLFDNWTSHTESYVLFNKKNYTDFDGAAVVFKHV